jgi:hypothetical protein
MLIFKSAAQALGVLATLGIVNDCVHLPTGHLSPLAIIVLIILAVVFEALGD